MINWQDLHHSQISPVQLYAALALRSAVFVVEQQCVYQDVDGQDLCGENRHLFGWRNGALIAYARILQPESATGPVVIGRVIVAPGARGEKLGYALMEHALRSCRQNWPGRAIYLGAQAHLADFYRRLGFTPVTDVYDEDGIPHVGMVQA
ncbi:GNAT family N-acetyltransferase [Shimwellia blattae]|uniref:Protein ElaA n=1 Tax=Shimwellia blattae (strain ATCC 29907 / DSM 4481 / JCM 1650 / NBRC 105725 / CDC 9005-74) TaxID=630626 RepID=I2B782_SHIBC|nr:GNAT family N-acetyltransferase [Shimwellia blattae]AFJ46386.1 putative GCN5-related N-acetyltransferase [Shimwellia blattae DSM 4481 = NBRC 105725]GAB79969.1 ElaA protein [Shimwellia blattae DSM 4481 = NBRC 105725]VDY63853.1 putative acyltransferase [Shimwellia blattae]VEC21991.1 putative acyltransferase [Shimwellia blattae]